MRWPGTGVNIAIRQTQEFGRHREFAAFLEAGPRRFKNIRRTCEIGCANRDQFVYLARRNSSRFIVGERARCAIVSGVPELPGDELRPRGSVPERKSGKPSGPANKFTHRAGLSGCRERTG